MAPAIAFVLAVAIMMIANRASPQTDDVTYCLNTDERERVRALLMDAIDAEFKEYTMNAFGNMIKDPVDQPARAIAGIKPAVIAYAKGRRAVMSWTPPICEVK